MKLTNVYKVSLVLVAVMVSIAWADTPYFKNVASSVGVADTGSGNGAAWIDYDNDGDLDLYFVNDPGSGGFYRNNLKETGSATFTSVSVGVTGNGNSLPRADYDGDGNMDVLVGRSGNAILYRNKGDGTFEDVTAFSGISVTNSTLSVWGNYFDQYGKPDLYFGQVGKLYKNNGDGTFTDTTEVLPSTPSSATPAWVDYDNDGYDDLFLAPFSGDLILYHNRGDGTFEDVSTAAGLDLPGKNARIAVGDYDNNGFDDIYFFAGGGNNYLFANNGNGTFTEVAFAAGVQTTAGTGNYDVDFLDFDLDGDLDLFANGGRYGSNNFFLNNGDGTFTDITGLTGLSNTDDTHDIAVGDFNGDSYPDIYEINFTGYGSSANKLFLNTVCEPPELPPEPWSFVHITDTHIGAENARESLMAVVQNIKHLSTTPNFILVTGDIADHGCNWWHDCDNPGHYDQFTGTIGLPDIPYYAIPGNHDRRRQDLVKCTNTITCYEAVILGLQPTVNFFPQLSVENYWFKPEGKGYIFIGLDTGPDNWAANDYLTKEQMEDLRELGNNNKCIPKIVFMHHPAVATDHPIWGNMEIVNNREQFLTWCQDNDVRVVIQGHRHNDEMFDRNEEEWEVGTETGYVLTPSCGKGDRGFRIFNVNGGIVSACDVIDIQDILNNRYEVEPNSPVEVHVYDSQGRHVGGNQSSVVEGEIPGSYYLPHYSVETEDGSDDYPEKIIIFDPTDDYLCEVIGTEEGTYGLNITFVSGGEEITFEAAEIPTSPGAKHVYAVDWAALSAGEEGVILEIDADGDGVFERTVVADEDLTSDEFALQTETIIDFEPDVLNLGSQGKFVTVYIELPEGFDVSQIDVSSLMLNVSVPGLSTPVEIGDYDSDGMADLMVKFARQQVAEGLEAGEQIVYLTGRLGDGTLFAGIDIIRVLESKGGEEAIDAEEAAGFTLFEAAERINELDPENFNNEDSATALTNEIYFVLSIIDEQLYTEAVFTLHNDILERTNGCADIGEPDENDWITTYEGQGEVYPLIVEAIELLESLIQ